MMEALVRYMLKVSAILAAFFLVWKFTLYGKTLHKESRLYLLSASVLSFILPLVVITVTKTVETAPVGAVAGTPTAMGTVQTDTRDFNGLGNILFALYLAGAAMVTVGSIAVQQPELFLRWLERYGAERLILGADVRNGKVSINGWKEDSSEDLLPFLKRYIDAGVRHVLCTEISKDGTLAGPATALYRSIMEAYPDIQLIASGGVSCIEDIRALNSAGIPAVVFGKAIYEGRINLHDLIAELPLKPLNP